MSGESGQGRARQAAFFLAKGQALLVVLYAASLPLSLTASWVILCLGLATWLAQILLASIESRSFCPDIAKPPLLIPLAAFAGALICSGANAGGLSGALDSLDSLRALAVYFWAYQIFRGNRSLMLLVVPALLVVAAAAGVLGTVEQVANFHPFGYRYLQGTGFLGGPMAYAGQMQIFSMLSLAMLLQGSFKQFRLGFARGPVFAFVVAANLSGVIFAGERNAWLGAVCGAIVLAALLSWRALARCCLVLIVLSALGWLALPVVHTRIASLGNWQQDISVRVRLQIWHESLNIWRSAPLLGVGIRNYPHFNIPEAIVPGHSKDLNHAHSNYLHILATTGLIGLVTYLYLWLVVLQTAFLSFRQASAEAGGQLQAAVSLGILAGTVALLVSGLFEYNFGASQIRLAQWFLLAMLPAVHDKSKGC